MHSKNGDRNNQKGQPDGNLERAMGIILIFVFVLGLIALGWGLYLFSQQNVNLGSFSLIACGGSIVGALGVFYWKVVK